MQQKEWVLSSPYYSAHLLVYGLMIHIRFWEMTKCGSELHQAKLISDSQSRSSSREAVASAAVFPLAAFCSLRRATPAGTFRETPDAVCAGHVRDGASQGTAMTVDLVIRNQAEEFTPFKPALVVNSYNFRANSSLPQFWCLWLSVFRNDG